MRPFAARLTITYFIAGGALASGCRSPQPIAGAADADTSSEAASLTESEESNSPPDGAPESAIVELDGLAPDGFVTPDATSADCSETLLGPLSHDRASVTAFLCERRPRCHLHEFVRLTSEKDAMVAVASVWINEKEVEDGSVDQFVSVLQEHWLLRGPQQGRLTRHLLATATGFLGDDSTAASAKVEGNRLHYVHRHAAASGRWYARSEADIAIHPLALVEESLSSGDGFSFCRHSGNTWNWQTFSGSRWFRAAFSDHPEPPFDPGGNQPVNPGQDVCRTYEYALIPDVRLDEAFGADGWKSAALGRCALDVDGSKGHGYLRFGKTRGRSDASFRVLLAGPILFVEVRDDIFTGPTQNWVNDDHLEIWLGPEVDDRCSLGCMEETETEHRLRFPAYQWGVRIMDAQVFPAAGRPTAMVTVERIQVDANTVRLRIELPEPFNAITVAYSDSDDGRTQKSLLATSRFTFGDGSTLGTSQVIDPSRATCTVLSGSLEPVRAPPPGPRCTLFSGD